MSRSSKLSKSEIYEEVFFLTRARNMAYASKYAGPLIMISGAAMTLKGCYDAAKSGRFDLIPPALGVPAALFGAFMYKSASKDIPYISRRLESYKNL